MIVGSLATNVYCNPRSTEDGDYRRLGQCSRKLARDIRAGRGDVRLRPADGVRKRHRHAENRAQNRRSTPSTMEVFQLSNDEHDQMRFARAASKCRPSIATSRSLSRRRHDRHQAPLVATRRPRKRHLRRPQLDPRPEHEHRLALRRILVRPPRHARGMCRGITRIPSANHISESHLRGLQCPLIIFCLIRGQIPCGGSPLLRSCSWFGSPSTTGPRPADRRVRD